LPDDLALVEARRLRLRRKPDSRRCRQPDHDRVRVRVRFSPTSRTSTLHSQIIPWHGAVCKAWRKRKRKL
jgi:hypothetical protein